MCKMYERKSLILLAENMNQERKVCLKVISEAF